LTARDMNYRLDKLESSLGPPAPARKVDLSWLTTDELKELAQIMRRGDTAAAQELWQRIQQHRPK
jgi:hypothetical protein